MADTYRSMQFLSEKAEIALLYFPHKLYTNSCGEDPRQRAHHRGREADVEGLLLPRNRKSDSSHVIIDFGMACEAVKPGDNVALICGVQIPLILRIASETSKLVSPAIIPRLMIGRGWGDSLKIEDLTKIHLS